MAVGTTTALLLGFGGAAAGFGASKLMSGGSSRVSAPMALPQPPSVENAVAKGEDIGRKRKAMATQSIYTSPLGVSGQADIAKKTLLGQ